MSFDLDVQKQILDALQGDSDLSQVVSARIYDFAPQKANFPYVTLGDDSLAELDTSTHLGAVVTLTIHTWSAARGRKETKLIQGHIRRVLHRANLSAEGSQFHYCYWESSQSFIDSDGVTRHGVCVYNIFIQEE